MDGLETKVDGLETKVDGLETKVDGFETKVDGLETKMDSGFEELKAYHENHDVRLDRIEKDANTIREVVLQIGSLLEGDVAGVVSPGSVNHD